jgi:TatD DNase family protein
MFVDVHCHLSFPDFDPDREEIIRQMTESGLALLIDPGTDAESSRKSIGLAAGHPVIYANVGLHPHETSEPIAETTFDELAGLARSPKVVGIGEIGLDYHYPDCNIRHQQDAFRTMLRMAKQLDLPAVIHCREAWVDLFRILEEEKHSSLRGMMHCFSGDPAIARRCVQLGFAISIPGTVTYKRSMLPEVIHEIPVSQLLTETDAPYLSPVPHRGKRNSPLYVHLITERIAAIKNMRVEETAACIARTAAGLFGIG